MKKLFRRFLNLFKRTKVQVWFYPNKIEKPEGWLTEKGIESTIH